MKDMRPSADGPANLPEHAFGEPMASVRDEQRSNHALVAARERRGWEPARVACLLQVSTRCYERWEAGMSEPTLRQLRALCTLFAQPPEALGFVLYTPDASVQEDDWQPEQRPRNTRLTQMRQQQLCTRKELASQLGVVQTTIANWEQGRLLPRPRHLAALCAFFDCEPAALGYVQHLEGVSMLCQEEQVEHEKER